MANRFRANLLPLDGANSVSLKINPMDVPGLKNYAVAIEKVVLYSALSRDFGYTGLQIDELKEQLERGPVELALRGTVDDLRSARFIPRY